jgi:hypothetical protein
MIVKTGPALYRMNLIRELRDREHKVERQKRMAVILGLGCFGLLILSLLYSGLTMMQMEHVLKGETEKLAHLKQEYQKYKASNLIVDKTDIELLNNLQSKGIFWTRKLAAIAKYLPENYWITHIRFEREELRVEGFGQTNPKQDQLLVLDEYLNQLRADTTFSDVFKTVRLISANRETDATTGRVAFQFSALSSAKGVRK